MKKILQASLCTVLLVSSASLFAQDEPATTASTSDPGYKTAIGIRLSTDQAVVGNAISLKHFLNEKLALEAFLSFRNPVSIGALLEIHNPLTGTEGLKWFYGAGAYIGFDSDKAKTSRDLLGVMGVVGLDYKFANAPINISLDWKPELHIIDDINFEPAAVGFTARFTFGKKNMN